MEAFPVTLPSGRGFIVAAGECDRVTTLVFNDSRLLVENSVWPEWVDACRRRGSTLSLPDGRSPPSRRAVLVRRLILDRTAQADSRACAARWRLLSDSPFSIAATSSAPSVHPTTSRILPPLRTILRCRGRQASARQRQIASQAVVSDGARERDLIEDRNQVALVAGVFQQPLVIGESAQAVASSLKRLS